MSDFYFYEIPFRKRNKFSQYLDKCQFLVEIIVAFYMQRVFQN